MFSFHTLENGVTAEIWYNIPGTNLNALTNNKRYPGKPDVSSKLPGLETQENIDDNYGLRLTTYFMVNDVLILSSNACSQLKFSRIIENACKK